MCGLVGYSGKKTADPLAIKMLLTLNRSRGKHSCGISWNDFVLKGVGQQSDSIDFVQDLVLPTRKLKTTAVIGHTRYATGGAHNKENAHPFAFENDDDEIEFIGAHNGVIYNTTELEDLYGLENYKYNVDSQLLLKILSMGHFDVLEKYNGYAALLFRFTNDPDSLYVWVGSSLAKNGSYHNAKYEHLYERPLHYYKKGGGIYISSLEEHLNVLSNGKDKPVCFNSNTLYIINNGEISIHSEYDRSQIKVDRNSDVAYLEKKYPDTKKNTDVEPYKYGYANDYDWESNKYSKRKNYHVDKMTLPQITPDYVPKDIVYEKGGRYYVNNKELNGELKISNTGQVGAGINTYYFINGVWFKDKATYNNNKGVKMSDIHQHEIHPDSVFYCKKRDVFFMGDNVKESWIANVKNKIIPKFSLYEYTAKKTGMYTSYFTVSAFSIVKTKNVFDFNKKFNCGYSDELSCVLAWQDTNYGGFGWKKVLEDASSTKTNNLFEQSDVSDEQDEDELDEWAEYFEELAEADEIEQIASEVSEFLITTENQTVDLCYKATHLYGEELKDEALKENLNTLFTLHSVFENVKYS